MSAVCARAELIGKWTFNEGGGAVAYDYSSAANHGFINGAKYVASPGETSSNSALHFDGFDDFVQYAHHPSYDVAGDFSIEAWINVPENLAEPLIFGQAVARFGLSAYAGSAFLYSDNDPFTNKGGVLTPNTYQHVVGVWDQSSQKVEIFVEGTSVGSAISVPPSASPAHNGDDYWTGKSNSSGSFGFLTGEIDEVRYYNHALSQQEINTNFSIGPSRLELAYTELPAKVQVPYPPGEENLYYSYAVPEPGTNRVMRLAFSSPYPADTVIGAMTTKTWYQVSTDNGVTFDGLRPLIQSGDYDRLHPIEPVHILKNSYVPSAAPPMIASNGEILAPFYLWPLADNGEPWVPGPGAYTYTDAGVLIGRWSADGNDVEWDLGETVRLQPDQSTRGAMEPALIELNSPGKILMVIRGSNESNHDLPAYKWKSVSEDYGRTWSDSSPMTYEDGENFFSASSASDIRRNSKNGQIYWFGNISESAFDNSPRYPFVFAQLDEESLGLFEQSVRVIEDINLETDSPQMQLSMSTIIENPEDGSYIVRLVRIDPGKPSEVLFFTVPIFARGDADFDNDVDLADLAVLAGSYGSSTGVNWMQGDFDNDGDVDLADLSSLAGNYGAGVSQAHTDFYALTQIPEPSMLAAIAASFAALVCRPVRRYVKPAFCLLTVRREANNSRGDQIRCC